MMSPKLAARAYADVERLLVLAKPTADRPPPEWDAGFVFTFALRVRLKPKYRRAVRHYSRLLAAYRFRHPDVTADPKDRSPDDSFAAWLGAAEAVAFAELREKLPATATGVPVTNSAPGRERVYPPVTARLQRFVPFFTAAAAAPMPRTDDVRMPSLAAGEKGRPERETYKFEAAGGKRSWVDQFQHARRAGELTITIPDAVSLYVEDVLLEQGGRLLTPTAGKVTAAGRQLVFAVGDGPTECALVQMSEVRAAYEQALASDAQAVKEAVGEIVHHGLAVALADELRWCAEQHPDPDARAAAQVALA